MNSTAIRNVIFGHLVGFLAVMTLATAVVNSPARDVVYPPDQPVELNVEHVSVDQPTHTNAQASAVCDWTEVEVWGAPNNITQLSDHPVHLWGGHQADCRYLCSGGLTRYCWLVDMVTGYKAYLGDCYA